MFFRSALSLIWAEQNDLRAIVHKSLYSIQIPEKTKQKIFFLSNIEKEN